MQLNDKSSRLFRFCRGKSVYVLSQFQVYDDSGLGSGIGDKLVTGKSAVEMQYDEIELHQTRSLKEPRHV